MKKIKVLVVDDSPLVRKRIKSFLESDPEIEVVDVAKDGVEALEKINMVKPDVVTLDIEMPRMDGIETLKRIMSRKDPIPCIMVSSLTKEGTKISLKALDLGAFDVITKPSAGLLFDAEKIAKQLVEKVKEAKKVDPRKLSIERRLSDLIRDIKGDVKEEYKLKENFSREKSRYKVVLIGISTGGPPALQKLLPSFPENFPIPIIVAQHMPEGFTAALAERLDKYCRLKVKEAENGDPLISGIIIIGKAGYHLKFRKRFGREEILLDKEPKEALYHPSVDVMFQSASEVFKDGKVLAVIMTGMGSDGARSLPLLKRNGAKIFSESKETCAIFGMPKAAIETGCVDKVLPLHKMAEAIMKEVVKE